MPAVGWSSRTQWSAYAAIVAVATLLAMVPATGPYFAWLFGELSPPVVVLAAGAVGAICLAALRRLDGFETSAAARRCAAWLWAPASRPCWASPS